MNLERTLAKGRGWEDGSGEETTAKKLIAFQTMTKNANKKDRRFFKEKIGRHH